MFCQAVDLLLSQPSVLDLLRVGVLCLKYDGPAAGEGALKIRLSRFGIAGKKLSQTVRRPQRAHRLRCFFKTEGNT